MRNVRIIMTAVIASLILPVSAFAESQQNQQQNGLQGGQGEKQRPSPEQMAEHLMMKFDANKDKELSQDELTQALETMRKNRPQGPGGEAQGNGPAGTSKGSKVGQGQQDHGGGKQREAQGDKQASPQGGQTGQHQGPPPAEKVAAKMIENFSSDKKGLKQAELVKALEDLHARRSQMQGGQGQQGQGGNKGSSKAETNNQL